jgi:hypothetical protein
MKKSFYLIVVGMAAAAGTAVGVYSNRKRPVRAALLGAAAGALAGAAAAGVCEHVTRDNRIPLYSTSSLLYDDSEAI